jgi:hypothetical protein
VVKQRFGEKWQSGRESNGVRGNLGVCREVLVIETVVLLVVVQMASGSKAK